MDASSYEIQHLSQRQFVVKLNCAPHFSGEGRTSAEALLNLKIKLSNMERQNDNFCLSPWVIIANAANAEFIYKNVYTDINSPEHWSFKGRYEALKALAEKLCSKLK